MKKKPHIQLISANVQPSPYGNGGIVSTPRHWSVVATGTNGPWLTAALIWCRQRNTKL